MTLRRRIQPQLSIAMALVLLALLLVGPRVWIELRWFEQFNLGGVLLRRLGLQLTALLLVLGIGIPIQLQQLQRCWKLRRHGRPHQGETVLLPLRGWGLACAIVLLLSVLATSLAYLLVQAEGLIEEPFSGLVLSSFPVLGELPLSLVIGLAAVLLVLLLRWPLMVLRITLTAAIVASGTALARGWSFWLPALLASPFGQGDPVTGIDLSFTVLRLPAVLLVLSVLMAQGLVGLCACLWLCLSQGTTLSDWHFQGLSHLQQTCCDLSLLLLP